MMTRQEFDTHQDRQLRLALLGSPDAEAEFVRIREREYPKTFDEVRRELAVRDCYVNADKMAADEPFRNLRVIGGVTVWYAGDIDRLIADEEAARRERAEEPLVRIPAVKVEIGGER
jgi:hypothetical protein